jgi:hypothetical protein
VRRSPRPSHEPLGVAGWLALYELGGELPDTLEEATSRGWRGLIGTMAVPTCSSGTSIWASEHIAVYRHEGKVIDHPDAGILTLDCDVLAAENNELRLVIYTARRHSDTADRLRQLQEAVDGARRAG